MPAQEVIASAGRMVSGASHLREGECPGEEAVACRTQGSRGHVWGLRKDQSDWHVAFSGPGQGRSDNSLVSWLLVPDRDSANPYLPWCKCWGI